MSELQSHGGYSLWARCALAAVAIVLHTAWMLGLVWLLAYALTVAGGVD